jgi:hypothetical protein
MCGCSPVASVRAHRHAQKVLATGKERVSARLGRVGEKERAVGGRAAWLIPVLAQRVRRGTSWRFGLLLCSQRPHAQTVLPRCAQLEETKPHS